MLLLFNVSLDKIVTDRLNPEALQTPSVAPRHDVLFLPAQHEQSESFKKSLAKRCKTQHWPAICDVQVKGLGRGVITTAKIDKGEILADYHREKIKGMRLNEFLDIHSNQTEYLFQLGQKHLIDASSEVCKEHPNNRCLARFFNHKSAKKANVKPVLINIAPNKDVLVFVAKTEIAPFEELCFDYGDEEARRMFDE